jgi:hypothetical protein
LRRERFRTLARRIKAHPNYNASIGEALGIEGAEQSAADLSTVQPRLKLKISGGVVVIGWGWGSQGEQLDMIRLEVDRGTGAGFVFLATDTIPGYNDSEPFPRPPRSGLIGRCITSVTRPSANGATR